MNNKIPFGRFAAMVAKITGKSETGTEAFLKDFFNIIAETVVAGEKVKIKGLGTFSPSGNPEHPVDFTPADEMARAINSPFELFSAEELAPDVTESILSVDEPQQELRQPDNSAAAKTAETQLTSAAEETADKPGITETEVIATPTTVPAEPCPPATPEPKPATQVAEQQQPLAPAPKPEREAKSSIPRPTPEPVNIPSPSPVESPAPTSSRLGIGIIIGLIIGIAIGACSVFFYLVSVGLA